MLKDTAEFAASVESLMRKQMGILEEDLHEIEEEDEEETIDDLSGGSDSSDNLESHMDDDEHDEL